MSKLRRPYSEVNLAQLRTFCAVAECGGFAAAARGLNLTSPAVWEQIQLLEGYYEIRLFERHRKGVQLTHEGERLLEMIQPLLTGLESSKAALHQESGALPKKLTIASILLVMVSEISEGMARFKRDIPMEIIYTTIDEIHSLIIEGEADVAITLEPEPNLKTAKEIDFELIGEIGYLLITPKKHKLSDSKKLSLKAIVRHPLILGRDICYSRRRVEEVFHQKNLRNQVNIAVETSSDTYTLDCVRAGLGVGITIGNGLGHLYQDLNVRSLDHWFGSARVGFIWKRGVHIPVIVRELAESLRNSL